MAFKEHDLIRTTKEIKIKDVMSNRTKTTIPKGTIGTIVFVYQTPGIYEVEFRLNSSLSGFVVATVEESQIRKEGRVAAMRTIVALSLIKLAKKIDPEIIA